MGIFKSAKKLITGEESAKDAFTDCEKLFDEIDEYRRSRHRIVGQGQGWRAFPWGCVTANSRPVERRVQRCGSRWLPAPPRALRR